MMRSIWKLAYPRIISVAIVAIIVTGCSNDDDNNPAGGAKVPDGAAEINATNAEVTIESAFLDANLLSTFNADPATLPVRGLLALAMDASQGSSETPLLATAVTETIVCSSGSITDTYTVIENTQSGTLSFNACDINNAIYYGDLDYSDTLNTVSSDYVETYSGSISISAAGLGDELRTSLNGLDYAQSGNHDAGTYTKTKLTMEVTIDFNGARIYGYLLQLSEPIVENSGDSCPESGSIKIIGANNTYAELTYIGGGMVTISANGSLITTTDTCYV